MLSKIYYKLVGYRSRYNYWTCSNFARYIQEVHKIPKKPNAATTKEWKEWREAAEKASPIGYWISDEGLGILQDIVYFFPDIYHNVYYKLRNAFVTRTHSIDTKLSWTEWHECDTRLTAGIFNILVEFVEEEKANRCFNTIEWSQQTTNDEEPIPTITDKRTAGLYHLDWEIGLGDESPIQSETAKEIKEIYLWIKDTYPNREDPHDVCGWSEYCDGKEFMFDTEEDEETRLHVRKMLKDVADLEQLYKDQDTDYLTRIVKIRENMWT